MSVRYQRGHLRCVKRKNGSSCWEFLWREIGPAGKPKHRTLMIGTLEQYPTERFAANAVNGLRISTQVFLTSDRRTSYSFCFLGS